MMISVVICSRDPRAAEWVSRNLRRTATHRENLQIIIQDNRSPSRGICAVYNEAVRKASGQLIVFMHEDAYMMESGWDELLRNKFAARPDVGVIGVAGSCALMREPPLWSKAGPPWTFGKVVHELDHGREYFLTVFNEQDGDQEVAVVDGVWMAVRAELLVECTFDSSTFQGFHFYDIDFCLTAGLCTRLLVTTDIRIKHFSPGSFGPEWNQGAQRLLEKWGDRLPIYKGLTGDVPPPGTHRFFSQNLKGIAPQITLI